jgi:hypothetical protein
LVKNLRSFTLDGVQQAFSTDWLKREPALLLAQGFADKPALWLNAVILIEALLDAMFGLSNLEIAQAKLGWWVDEADLTVSGAPRHPLTQEMGAQQAKVLPDLTRAALAWMLLSTAADASAQRSQFGEFARAASALVDEGDCTAMWTELALKRQLQLHAKPGRFGPCVLNRARLAEFQLKASLVSARGYLLEADRVLQAPALITELQCTQERLNSAVQSQDRGSRSATRAYAVLHAREAARWAKAVAIKKSAPLISAAPGILGLICAWRAART